MINKFDTFVVNQVITFFIYLIIPVVTMFLVISGMRYGRAYRSIAIENS